MIKVNRLIDLNTIDHYLVDLLLQGDCCLKVCLRVVND